MARARRPCHAKPPPPRGFSLGNLAARRRAASLGDIVSTPLTRILSDLHLGDERSALREAAQLAPLLDGVGALVLNGDTCDTQHDLGPAEVAALKEFFAARVPAVTLITGNHDPDISATHELALADWRVWLTHGDVLFDDLAPWSRLRPELARRLARIRPRHSAADWATIATRLLMMREACLKLPCEHASGLGGGALTKLQRAARDLFPPNRALAMLRVWATSPQIAAQLAAAQRPAAQVVVCGHIHFPGVWRSEGRVIVNTGSFSPPLGARCVDLAGEIVRVRRVERRGDRFHPGNIVAEFPLA
jgi:predicted phosphodiesterase